MVSAVIDILLYHLYDSIFEKLGVFLIIPLMMHLFFFSQSKKKGKIMLKKYLYCENFKSQCFLSVVALKY